MTWVAGIVALVMIFMIIRNPNFKSWLGQLGNFTLPTSTTPPASTTPPPTSTTPPPASTPPPSTTTSTDFPYAFVGSPKDLKDEGKGTRHYASGKPDDVTHEWTGKTSAKSYAMIIDITLTKIDHEDQVGFKLGGTHMGSGWYDMGYDFESGKACAGKEEKHPSTDLCEVVGTSIGSLVNKPAKLAAVNINKGEKLEMWSNLGSGWQKDVESSDGVTGFRPSVDEDEVTIRIDAAPGIDMRSAQVVEITPTGTTTPPATEGNIATVLTAYAARKELRRNLYNKTYRGYRREDGDFIPYNLKLQDLHYARLGGL